MIWLKKKRNIYLLEFLVEKAIEFNYLINKNLLNLF